MQEPEMLTPNAPDDVVELARRRAEARLDRKWAEADELRDRIEAAGWKVIDNGARFHLEPAHPPDLVVDGRTRYGSSASVPSRLDDAPTCAATVVLVADRRPEDLARALEGLRRHAPDGTHVVIVANAPTPEQATALIEQSTALVDPATALEPATTPGRVASAEVIWTSVPLGHAIALNIGIRRAAGAIVVVLDASIEPLGDFLAPLVAALDDPTVAVAGPWGLDSPDLRHFEETALADVVAVRGDCIAFRRADFAERGPLDERFRVEPHLDEWWSLVLRDEGPDRQPRRARRLDALPLERHPRRTGTPATEETQERLARRNFYRLTDRFGSRRDLLLRPGPG
jgi:hypothetical protein